MSYSQDAPAAQIKRNFYLIEENFVQQARRLGLVKFAYFRFWTRGAYLISERVSFAVFPWIANIYY